MNATTPRGSFAGVSNYLPATNATDCSIRFWTYMKGSNNGDLFVGYRYEIGDDIIRLTSASSISCATDALQCSWQRIDVSLSAVLNQSTEVRRETRFH